MENTTPTNNQPQTPPSNYLAWSIVVTLLCCWPLGIPAIVNAARVNGLWFAGNHAAAIEASNKAKKWVIATAITGAVVILLYFILMVVIGIGIATDVSDYSDYYYY